jgi:SAM-dependent methyltransferase
MLKEFYNKVYKKDNFFNYGGGIWGDTKRVDYHKNVVSTWLKSSELYKKQNAKILEIGPGFSFLKNIHPGWHGAEFSKTAVDFVKARDGISSKIFEEDSQSLSFSDESFEGIFSFSTFEHVPNPGLAFSEIDRVLKNGGFALIAPAWNCRAWTVKKIQQQPWKELKLIEKIESFCIPLLENLIFRAIIALPKRAWAELLMFLFPKRLIPLRLNVLSPRWDLIEKFGHVSDDDAVSSIDPHSCILFFLSRNYKILSHPTFYQRFFSRHDPVCIQKKIVNTLKS